MSNFGCNCSMLKIVLSIHGLTRIFTDVKIEEHIRRLLFAVAAALLVRSIPYGICGIGSTELAEVCRAAETERYIPWHLEEAELRFRIEKDPDYSQIPDVHLSDLEKKREWTGTYYNLNGKVYKKGIAMSAPATVTYKHEKEHGHFVALAGLADRASSEAQVTFEIYADNLPYKKKRLYRSVPVTKQSSPVEINVRVPSAAKELAIVTTDSNIKGHQWANLVNAGYLLRGENPEVSYVKLHTPGYDARDFEAVVFTTIGQRVPSRLLLTKRDESCPSEPRINTDFHGYRKGGVGEPMEILFDNSYGSTIYFVYLVHKSKYKPMSTSWEPKAGVMLETRYTNEIYPECKEMSGFLKVWDTVAEPVGRSLVDNIHHSFPIHRLEEFVADNAVKKPRLALYRYEGFFRTEEAGEHIFATASNWSSHLLVDGNLVISWPGEHDYRDGIKGEKQGKISLGAGVHKLEYLNYSPWGEMFTLAAWQKPQEKLGIMSRDDFLPVGRFVAAAIGYKDLTKDGGSFKWQISDDWRVDQGKAALVRMSFDVLEAKQDGYYSYRWRFDDGKIETGKNIEHVFLRPQMRIVTLEVLKGTEVVAQVKQEIPVHILWEKIQLEPKNQQAFEKAISDLLPRLASKDAEAGSDFSKVSIGDIVNLYAFADPALPSAAMTGQTSTGSVESWRQQTVAALTKRMDELLAESQHWHFCLELGRYLRSAHVRQYEQALTLFSRLREKSVGNPEICQHVMVSQAELLVQCFGKAKEALEILNQLEERKLDKKIVTRFRMAKAEALIALEHVEEAREILQSGKSAGRAGSEQPPPGTSGGKPDSTKQEVKNVGRLRAARQLADNTDDPEQLDYAMEKIEEIIADDPVKLLMPNLNLIKLDVHLARKEYPVAFYLAERLNKLELSNYYRSEVLLRQIKALCGIKVVDQAKVIYETMEKDYPYSPAVAEAKKAIVETVVAGQKQ